MGRRASPTPILCDDRGRKRARWTAGGKRHTLDLGPVADEPRWKAAYARLLSRLAADPLAPARHAGDLLVGDLGTAYLLADASFSRRDASGRAFALLADRHPDAPAADIGPRAFAEWRDHLCSLKLADGRTPRYTAGYVREQMRLIVRAYRWAAETERLPADCWHRLKAVAGPSPGTARRSEVIEAAEPEAIEQILPHLTPTVRAMVQLQRLTGMRPSELFRLTPGQVHRSGRVSVPGAGSLDLGAANVWVYLPDEHKTAGRGKTRWVILGQAAWGLLGPFLDRSAESRCFSPAQSKAESLAARAAARTTPRWPSHLSRNEAKRVAAPTRPAGDEYNRHSYRRAVHRACARAKVPPINPYTLRHLAATEIDAAFGLDAVQHALGHTTANVSRRYAKASLAKAVEVATGMERLRSAG